MVHKTYGWAPKNSSFRIPTHSNSHYIKEGYQNKNHSFTNRKMDILGQNAYIHRDPTTNSQLLLFVAVGDFFNFRFCFIKSAPTLGNFSQFLFCMVIFLCISHLGNKKVLLRHGQIKITFLIVLIINLKVMLIKNCVKQHRKLA